MRTGHAWLDYLNLLAETNAEANGGVHRDRDSDYISPFNSAAIKMLHREIAALNLKP